MRVFVKNMRGKALMPTTPKKARLLLEAGKAKIAGYRPFTIQLLYATGETRQPVFIGIDTGSKYIGIAVCLENKVLAAGTIELRQDISSLLLTRKEYRRGRRFRNTRYRKPRFQNRVRREDWLPPSIQSRIDNTIRWINKFSSLVPEAVVRVEVGKFDIQKILNPDIKGKEYQQGKTFGYLNDRYYIFARDHHTCQICHGKSGDKRLRTHHILEKINDGSDGIDNQATVCETCHIGFHKGVIRHIFKKSARYKEPTFMNILRKKIFNALNCEITYGSRTIIDREFLGLDKSHDNDAIAISGILKIKINDSERFYIKQFRKKKRSLHEATPRKGRKSKNVNARRNKKNTPEQAGFYINDKVKLFNRIGYISGFTSSGAYIKDMNDEYITLPEKSYKQVSIPNLEFVCQKLTTAWLTL